MPLRFVYASAGAATAASGACCTVQYAASRACTGESRFGEAGAGRSTCLWDRDNILLFSGVAVFRGLDYASTRNMQARGRQEILLPDDVVNNSAGFASLEAAATMTSVGISYIFHRTGHHKLERWMSIGHIGVAAFGDVRNYCLKTSHPH